MTDTNHKKTFALGTDHAGYLYKEVLKQYLLSEGHEVKDFGAFSEESVDYPVPVKAAARAVAEGLCELGIVLGGSGNGESNSTPDAHSSGSGEAGRAALEEGGSG